MARTLTRKGLVKKLDNLTSQIIRKKYEDRCVVCGSTEKPTNGHLFSRDTYSTRWDTHDGGNCACQCWPCNYRHEYDPAPYTAWYIKKYGLEAYEALSRRRVSKPWKQWELEEIRERLEKELEEI
jgi:hypothetical protein